MNARQLSVAHQTSGECQYCDNLYEKIRAAFFLEAADFISESEALRDHTDDHMSDVYEAASELRREVGGS